MFTSTVNTCSKHEGFVLSQTGSLRWWRVWTSWITLRSFFLVKKFRAERDSHIIKYTSLMSLCGLSTIPNTTMSLWDTSSWQAAPGSGPSFSKFVAVSCLGKNHVKQHLIQSGCWIFSHWQEPALHDEPLFFVVNFRCFCGWTEIWRPEWFDFHTSFKPTAPCEPYLPFFTSLTLELYSFSMTASASLSLSRLFWLFCRLFLLAESSPVPSNKRAMNASPSLRM